MEAFCTTHSDFHMEKTDIRNTNAWQLCNSYLRICKKKMLKKGVERLSRKTWCLPHLPVFSEFKPDKIRIVFDAAIEHDGISLRANFCTRQFWAILIV